MKLANNWPLNYLVCCPLPEVLDPLEPVFAVPGVGQHVVLVPHDVVDLGPEVLYRLLQVPDHGCLRLGLFSLLLDHQTLGALLLEVVEALQVRLVQEQLQTSLVKVEPALARTVEVPNSGSGEGETMLLENLL